MSPSAFISSIIWSSMEKYCIPFGGTQVPSNNLSFGGLSFSFASLRLSSPHKIRSDV